jgi:hypothetical protein
MLGTVAACTERAADRDVLIREATLIVQEAETRIASAVGREEVARAYEDMCRVVESHPKKPVLSEA